LKKKFGESFKPVICALETDSQQPINTEEVSFILNTDHEFSFKNLVAELNQNQKIELIVVQHEFGFFEKNKDSFLSLLAKLNKPICTVFHTVLPKPSEELREHVRAICEASESMIVMTKSAQDILVKYYGIFEGKINFIAHGTHLVPHTNKNELKTKYKIPGRKILATFGLLSSGKSIETTLDALPKAIANHPDLLFLIIGKTHPSILKQEGEKYRDFLKQKIKALGLENHVKFINDFLPTPTLLEYLQLTDIYLFTSNDPNQAVSGTFSYAVASGCPVISTPIPHAIEVLGKEVGIIVEFNNPNQLAEKINLLLTNDQMRNEMAIQAQHQMAPTAWENSAIKHMNLFYKISRSQIPFEYAIPEINLAHMNKMTTEIGMVQFAIVNQPDLSSGYTIDDNARALIALCELYENTGDHEHLTLIQTYLDFIAYCQQPNGSFLNYVDEHKNFTIQNDETNLDDSNGRTIWALGVVLSKKGILPIHFIHQADEILQNALPLLTSIYSTRSMAFIIKGLHYAHENRSDKKMVDVIQILADRLVAMFEFENNESWLWYESYLSYANSIIPEALLLAYLTTEEPIYREIAQRSFNFLLAKTFDKNHIQVISNKYWLEEGQNYTAQSSHKIFTGGEQAIDVSYTIMALHSFYTEFGDQDYLDKMKSSFNWFLGDNSINQIIYNPCTGGCFDGLEEKCVNLNQGAESTISYLLARLVIQKDISIEVEMKDLVSQ
jgi:glycosyltransferase involved in cell wall biosynthesis